MKAGRINVLVTGLGGGGHGMQVLKALKMSNLPYNIVGTDIRQPAYGFAHVDHWHIVPPANHAEYIPALVDIARQHDLQVLFPGSDPELRVVSRQRQAFQELKILLPINPDDLLHTCLNKQETVALLRTKGFVTPRTTTISSAEEIADVDWFPVVCKPLSGGGSSNVFIAQDADELRLLSAYLLRYLDDILLQEYIGTPDSEYTVGVLTDLNGEMVDAIGVKRDVLTALSSRIKVPNRTGRKELGEVLAVSSGISQGKIGRFGSITEYCKKVALAIGAKGPVNMQCRVVRDTIYIFEINPRFSGTTSLRAMVGFNEPDILIRIHLLGEAIGRINYREGVILRGLDEQIFGEKKPFEN